LGQRTGHPRERRAELSLSPDAHATWGMMRLSRTNAVVIASKATRSGFGDCGCGSVWIASLSLAMTAEIEST
jgi:hypothetical protein